VSRLSPVYIERRSEPRSACSLPARVYYGQGLRMFADGLIRDISTSGAKIEVPSIYKLPPRFVLLHLQAGVALDVVLKWRRGDLAGMAFERQHILTETDDPRLADVKKAWQGLQPNAPAARGPGMIG